MLSKPVKLMFIGAGALIVGWLLALFTVMKIVQPSFFVLFVSYVLSLGGLLTGLIGVYTHFPFPGR